MFQTGQRVRLPGHSQFRTVDMARDTPAGWRVYLLDDGDQPVVEVRREDAAQVVFLEEDGAADPPTVLAAFWTQWMRAATQEMTGTALATSVLQPYAHQMNAVYGAMLPQPRLRFLLADEPGTGKTAMAGMYVREMQRLGYVRRALVVAPAHLVTKWIDDFDRFFGGGLRRITAATISQNAMSTSHALWIVSLQLAAQNPAVQEAIRPDAAGWDLVVFDEAHRLTPTAETMYRVGRLLARHTPRALLMTATPHRGKEWLFRSLMHLVDPEVFPEAQPNDDGRVPLRPGGVHFLRRMKEDLKDHDGTTPLFRGRRAQNISVPLNATEASFYEEALLLVDEFFPTGAAPLAKMVYGKRAASSLYALAQTLTRRRDLMGTDIPASAALAADPDGDDPPAQDEARVVSEQSRAAQAERSALNSLLTRLEPLLQDAAAPASKWPRMRTECLEVNGIHPGNGQQAVVFTEYADTADWLVGRFRAAGYSVEVYSGRVQGRDRDEIRARFARRDFQVIISTDAGNEGIDLQTAHVLVNWDIPWSLVTLEQRMGRVHRIGQTRDVELYNLIATGTREGEVLQVLLHNFVVAANRLGGRMFDSLSAVGEMVGVDIDRLLRRTYADERGGQDALNAAQAVTAARVEEAARRATEQERALATTVDMASAVEALRRETLERINPRIVEAFLRRLADAGVYQVRPNIAGDGLFLLDAPAGCLLPEGFGRGGSALVATSGAALRAAADASVDVTGVVTLGPGTETFRALVSAAAGELDPALERGGVLRDTVSSTGYDLFVFQSEVSRSMGRTVWPFLIRVDATGARPVRWELLANLVPGSGSAGPPHPARLADGKSRAATAVTEEQGRRAAALAGWLAQAERDLERLPTALLADIPNHEARQLARERLARTVETRRGELRTMAALEMGSPRRLGWARVEAGGTPPEPTEADSENVAMLHMAEALHADGWSVADVHTEGRGYDLHAVRGGAQRCVEVKGVWDSAASAGIRLTGNEVLIARQFGRDYWLYVVDRCREGGVLFGAYPDPAVMFGDEMREMSVVRIPGSALIRHREETLTVERELQPLRATE